MSRVICISNRVSLPDPQTGQIKAGGLAVGIKAALRSTGDGIWFGWNGTVCAQDTKARSITKTHHDNITFITFPLRTHEYEGYYKEMSNECLWPLMHGLGDCIRTDVNGYAAYRQVNRMFAKIIKPYIRPGDAIWIHDYHLIPLAKELRALGVKERIGYFHHIPVPSIEFVSGPDVPLSVRRQYKQLLHDLFDCDLVGFQSFRDLRNFKEFLQNDADCPARFQAKAIQYKGRMTAFGVFPISIETADISHAAQKNHSDVLKPNDGSKTIIGAERLDYTKGLPFRLSGYYEFLDSHPEYHGKIQYHQITPLSRTDIQQYKTAIENTRLVVKEIQDDFDRNGRRHLIYSEDNLPRSDLISRMRASNVGLVTPLIDGQNLVAKEYIAAQSPRDPGMLVLSRNAGAAEELEALGILCVDPYDPADIARKIYQALETPLLKRLEVYRKAISHLHRYDIEYWAEHYLQELGKTRHVRQSFSVAHKLIPSAQSYNL